MGSCLCNAAGTEEEKRINQQISNHLKAEISGKSTEHRILLLGPGDSGKTTILKQMRKIHDGSIPPDTIDSFAQYIRSKTVQYMKILCDKSIELNIALEPIQNDELDIEQSRQYLSSLSVPYDINADIAEHIKLLWQNKGIQETLNQRHKFQIPDNVQYFFEERIDDIASDSYTPTFEDYLRIRMRTTGINQELFTTTFGADGKLLRNGINGHTKVTSVSSESTAESNNTPKATAYKDLEIEIAKEEQYGHIENGKKSGKKKQKGVEHKFYFMDVGGQRAERKKWINMLTDNIDAVVYILAISEYDLMCFEDSSTLRLNEALKLFKEVLSKGFMRNKTVTLFFNKYDLLIEKLQDETKSTISDHFPEFPADQDPRDPKAVCDFVYEKFKEIFHSVEKGANSVPHYHTTSALDAYQIDNLMADMQRDLIRKQLQMAGF